MADESAQSLAKDTNRETWALLQRDDRNEDDDERMVHAAHASAFYWEQAGGDTESTRADWLLSHVYAVLGRAEPAVHYARRCLATCERAGIGGFDVAYAYEAMARSAAAAGFTADTARWRDLAEQAALTIADSEDRELFLSDLAAEPWFNA